MQAAPAACLPPAAPAACAQHARPCSTLTCAPLPTRMLPRTRAQAPMRTLSEIFGCRSPSSFPVPPSVTCARCGAAEQTLKKAGLARKRLQQGSSRRTLCKMDTLSPTTAVSPITTPVPWSSRIPCPKRAPGWMSAGAGGRRWEGVAHRRRGRRQASISPRRQPRPMPHRHHPSLPSSPPAANTSLMRDCSAYAIERSPRDHSSLAMRCAWGEEESRHGGARGSAAMPAPRVLAATCIPTTRIPAASAATWRGPTSAPGWRGSP